MKKVVTRSSTRSEVVGVYHVLQYILWTQKFIEKLGVTIAKTIVYQDNMGSILLERNGCQSSTKRTKHMAIWYFYISDQVKQCWMEHTSPP